MMPTKKAKNIYSLVAKYSKNGMTGEEVIKVPCFELKEKTQLSNIDLFTTHFEDSDSLIEFCKANDLMDKKIMVDVLLIKCTQPYPRKGVTTFSFRPVIFSDNQWIAFYAARDKVECRVERNQINSNIDEFTTNLLQNYMSELTLRTRLTAEDVLYDQTKIPTDKKIPLATLILNYPTEREILKSMDSMDPEKQAQKEKVENMFYQIVNLLSEKYRQVRDIAIAELQHRQNGFIKIKTLDNKPKLEPLNELLGNPTPNPKIMDVETNKMFDPDRNPYSHTDGFDRPEVPIEQEVPQILTTDEQLEEITFIDLNTTQNNPLEYPGQISMEEIIDEQESFGKQKRLVPPGPYIPTEE